MEVSGFCCFCSCCYYYSCFAFVLAQTVAQVNLSTVLALEFRILKTDVCFKILLVSVRLCSRIVIWHPKLLFKVAGSFLTKPKARKNFSQILSQTAFKSWIQSSAFRCIQGLAGVFFFPADKVNPDQEIKKTFLLFLFASPYERKIETISHTWLLNEPNLTM